jgi:hypothetical protein
LASIWINTQPSNPFSDHEEKFFDKCDLLHRGSDAVFLDFEDD